MNKEKLMDSLGEAIYNECARTAWVEEFEYGNKTIQVDGDIDLEKLAQYIMDNIENFK